VYAMNAYVEVDVQLHSYLTLLLDASKLSSSSSDRFTPNCLNSMQITFKILLVNHQLQKCWQCES